MKHEEIKHAYQLLGREATLYDGMITCSTLFGKVICKLVWDMNNVVCTFGKHIFQSSKVHFADEFVKNINLLISHTIGIHAAFPDFNPFNLRLYNLPVQLIHMLHTPAFKAEIEGINTVITPFLKYLT